MAGKGSCKVADCEREARGKGYCDRHYRKWRKGLLGKPRYRTCVEAGCRKPRARRSLCEEHYASKFGKKKAGAEPAAAVSPAPEAAGEEAAAEG